MADDFDPQNPKGLYDYQVIADQVSGLITGEKKEPDFGVNLSDYLFDKFTPEQTRESVRNLVEHFMKPIRESKGIYSNRVGNVFEDTWENAYPVMTHRLRAIEGVEKFGGRVSDEDYTEEMKAYPFKRVETYFIVTKHEDGYTSRDYYSSSDNSYPPEDLQENETVETVVSWEIYNPEGHIIAEVFITPTVPIEYIRLDYTINKDGATFEVPDADGSRV